MAVNGAVEIEGEIGGQAIGNRWINKPPSLSVPNPARSGCMACTWLVHVAYMSCTRGVCVSAGNDRFRGIFRFPGLHFTSHPNLTWFWGDAQFDTRTPPSSRASTGITSPAYFRLALWSPFAYRVLVKKLQRTIKAVIRPGDERGYVAECLEIAVITQGATLDETVANLKEAVQLHLEGEDLAELGLAPNPALVVTMELEPAYA
jgi:predicted RNase H-like HicB family nuclease